MKKFILVFAFYPLTLTAQEYNVASIPDSLREKADVVKRLEEVVLTIKSPAEFKLHIKRSFTILNEAGAGYAGATAFYDKFSAIRDFSGRLFNGQGREIGKTKQSNWEDYSAFDEGDLMSDDRFKQHRFYSTEYPYTVEYEIETAHYGTTGFPAWIPQDNLTMSVQNSRFIVIAPAAYNVRFKPVNLSGEPVITHNGATTVYTWEIKNIIAKKPEKFAPPASERIPRILFAPADFEMQSYKGNMSTWTDYGKYIYQLTKGRDVLPPSVKLKVHALTDQLSGDREKIAVLYDYLQKNTRYISVQLGIGGWQPFDANYVAEKKYGDCKALSNFMIALLKEAGITGRYVELYSGDNPPPFVEDFPFGQANHVIACVPLAKDTVWLECTDQDIPVGFLGNFTCDRKAILIDESGGHIVHTPAYKLNDNVSTRVVHAIADAEGNLAASVNTTYTGLQQEFPHALLHRFTAAERERYLNQLLDLPSYRVEKNEYTERKGWLPSMHEYLLINIENYASITGRRLFINPAVFRRSTIKLEADSARQNDYCQKYAYRYIDSVEIIIPSGYKPEFIPAAVLLLTKFGKYHCVITVAGNRIIYNRLMEKYDGRFPAKEYNAALHFYDQVIKSDNAKIVFVKED